MTNLGTGYWPVWSYNRTLSQVRIGWFRNMHSIQSQSTLLCDFWIWKQKSGVPFYLVITLGNVRHFCFYSPQKRLNLRKVDIQKEAKWEPEIESSGCSWPCCHRRLRLCHTFLILLAKTSPQNICLSPFKFDFQPIHWLIHSLMTVIDDSNNAYRYPITLFPLVY